MNVAGSRLEDLGVLIRAQPTKTICPAGFDELIPKTVATATVDPLLHHAHVCKTSGDFVRLTQALAGKE